MRRQCQIVVILTLFIGCTKSEPTTQETQPIAPKNTNTPEGVYRRFMIANLYGNESEIRPLIVDNENADVLWQGAYPDDVAAALAEQYRSMEISRIESADQDQALVLLQSSASPIPLAAVNVEGVWRIDASPVIQLRKNVQEKE